jgi:hypothetical protein
MVGSRLPVAVHSLRFTLGETDLTIAKLSSPSERVLSTCVDRGARSRPLRRWSERGGTAKKLNRTELVHSLETGDLVTDPSAPSRFAASVACSAWLGSLGMARRSAWPWHWPRIWPFVLSRRSELGNGIARARHRLLAGTGLAIGWRSVRPRHGPRMAHGHGARPFKIFQDTHRSHRACCLGRLLAPSQPLC